MVSLRDASKDDAKAPSFSTRFRIRSAARRAGEDVIDNFAVSLRSLNRTGLHGAQLPVSIAKSVDHDYFVVPGNLAPVIEPRRRIARHQNSCLAKNTHAYLFAAEVFDLEVA